MQKDFNHQSQRELVARTFRQALTKRYGVPTDDGTLSSLIEIVMSSADEDASAVTLKSLANYHINNIVLLHEYSSNNYNLYMEFAWGKGYVFTMEQTIDDYIMAWNEFGDFHLSSTAHFIFYNQDIWSNEEFDKYSSDDIMIMCAVQDLSFSF